MIRTNQLMIAVMYVFLAAGCCSAKDIYVAQDATGAETGADCADAHPVSWFNTASNWGSTAGRIGAGTTVHLCGIFTAPGGTSGYLKFHGSGASANPITLHFENGAVLTAPYWGQGGSSQIGNLSYLVVDGVCTASDPMGRCSSTQGTIQSTLNGSPDGTCPGGPCQFQVNGSAISMGSCDNCEIKNLTIADMYVHTPTSNDRGQHDALWLSGNNNLAVDNNIIHDAHWAVCLSYTPAGTVNLSVFNNNIWNVDHGVAVASSGNSSLSGLYIYNILIHDFANWDTASDYDLHDGVHIFATSTSTISPPVMIYNNHFYGNFGANDNTAMFIEVFTGGSYMGEHYVFNNIIAPSGGGCANGGMAEDNGLGGNGMHFYNNTMIGCGIDIAYAKISSATNAVIENNIYSGSGASGETGIDNVVGGSTIAISNYNLWYGTWTNNPMRYSDWFKTMALWTSKTGFDRNSITTNPKLSPTFQLTSTSPAIGAGTNLTSICKGQPVPGLGALCKDYVGNPRPPSGNWDMGAYVHTLGSPTGLTGVVH